MINNREANELMNQAMLCKMFGCRPSELAQEDPEICQLFLVIYLEMAKKNPLALFM